MKTINMRTINMSDCTVAKLNKNEKKVAEKAFDLIFDLLWDTAKEDTRGTFRREFVINGETYKKEELDRAFQLMHSLLNSDTIIGK